MEPNIKEEEDEGDAKFESSIRVDEELGAVLDHDAMDSTILTLPSSEIPRTVPGGCAICLCPYEEGDAVTWSCKQACPHAFHQDCIIPWLAKSNEPKCPCCRQEFCTIEPISDPTHPLSFLTPFGLVPTAIASPVRQMPFFVRGPLRLPLSTTDLILAPRISHVHTLHPPQINLSQPYQVHPRNIIDETTGSRNATSNPTDETNNASTRENDVMDTTGSMPIGEDETPLSSSSFDTQDS